ncbi:MAG: response regulator transcription factor, partial [Arenibacter algicola]|nr:response regulator transcription factor [Arenibacter algicola]
NMHSSSRQSRSFLVGYARAYRLELTEAFREQGFEVLVYADAALAAMALEHHSPDVVLMNWSDGAPMSTMKFVEQYGGILPVLVHSNHDVLFDVVRSLRAGAADYVRAPCFFPELLARVERAQAASPTMREVSSGGLSLNTASGVLHHDGGTIQLTDREARILGAMMKCPERPVSRENLMHIAAIKRAKPTIIESDIKQLRKKHPLLRDSLKTKYGKGYVFVVSGRARQNV